MDARPARRPLTFAGDRPMRKILLLMGLEVARRVLKKVLRV
jgi:hypothetical protein